MSDTVSRLLRAALAFVFVYAALDAWVSPDAWIGYFPVWTRGIVPDPVLLGLWGVLELFVAAWIISGIRVAVSAAIAAALLVGVVVANPSQFQVVFRDLALALVALALVVDERERSRA